MKYNEFRFDEVTTNHDRNRIPLSSVERSKRQGQYRYYGAQSVIDYVDDYLFDGKYLLIAEDGENLKSNKQNIAQIVSGQFWVNNHAHIIQTTEKCNIDYLCYLINSMDLSGYITGSAQPKLSQANMNAISLNLPDRLIQDKIVSILGLLDTKISTNNEINKNLEQQAQAIFQSWFINFDQSDGEMPLSWHIVKLGDIATIKTNTFSPNKNPEIVLEHYSIPAYDEHRYPVFEIASGVKSNKYILTPQSVMISKLNPDTKRVWRPMCLSDNAVSSTEFIIFEANNPAYKDYIYSIIDSAPFSDWMCAHTTGSTNSRQRTTPSTTLEYSIAMADEATILNFCSIVTPMYEQIAQNLCENQRLSKIRDSLLPKLISGELDVSDIEL